MGAAACSEECRQQQCSEADLPGNVIRRKSSQRTFVETVRVLSSPMEEEVVQLNATSPYVTTPHANASRQEMALSDFLKGDLEREDCSSEQSTSSESYVRWSKLPGLPREFNNGDLASLGDCISEISDCSEPEIPSSNFPGLATEFGGFLNREIWQEDDMASIGSGRSRRSKPMAMQRAA